jgi:hypothetical protein
MLAAILAAVACHVGGQAPFLRPDAACTPGAFQALPLTKVCRHKERPGLPSVERRAILVGYGVPGFTGRVGELDHRIPFFLGGTTDRRNIWPEAGRRPNPKDDLEQYVRQRVCVTKTMRLRTARAIFKGDWVVAYRRYQIS